MKKLLTSILLLGMGLTASNSYAALTTTASTDALALANAIVGSGVTVTGASLSGDTGNDSAGSFSGGDFGIESGVLLTTGSVAGALGPNNTSSNTTGSGSSTTLSFDFEFDGGLGGDIYFQYIFASEEYLEYIGSQFNDIFTLSIDNENLALIPSTSNPVSINSVNDVSNSAYYQNNTSFALQYDGLTTLLTAQVLGLSSGSHTATFYISDIGDSSYDSGVFISGESFTTVAPSAVPVPAAAFMFAPALLGFLGLRRKNRA